MSFILDALRRADAQRERGQVPGLHSQSVAPPAPAAPAPRSRASVVALLSALCALLTLAIMNVLPIPALDGGRLYMMLASRLTKAKRLTPSMEESIVGWSFVGLMALIVLITIVDVKRFF